MTGLLRLSGDREFLQEGKLSKDFIATVTLSGRFLLLELFVL